MRQPNSYVMSMLNFFNTMSDGMSPMLTKVKKEIILR